MSEIEDLWDLQTDNTLLAEERDRYRKERDELRNLLWLVKQDYSESWPRYLLRDIEQALDNWKEEEGA